MSTPEEIRAFYEEQLKAQRGMLSGAIDALKDKNAFLEKSLAQLKNRNHQLERISYSAFHEMRAPLTSLLGLVRMIDEENYADLNHVLLTGTEDLVLQLDRFAGGLHEFTTELNRPLNFENFDLREVLNVIIETNSEVAEKHNIVFHADFCTEENSPFCLNHDRKKVQLVLEKVINNAVEYAKKVGAKTTITVSGKQRKDGALLWVKDDGPGMPQHVVLKAAEMFYKGTNTSRGAGLGLYITKMIMAEHEGLFKITSREGEGTTVFLKFKDL